MNRAALVHQLLPKARPQNLEQPAAAHHPFLASSLISEGVDRHQLRPLVEKNRKS
jgi:hypothetical protein